MTEQLARLSAALADRYRIERPLGAGGMATVYLAEDLKHHRHVAVKVLRPDLAATLGPDRFLREIEVAARLQHPHILPLLDSGEADAFLFYVMPFVEGRSLRERLVHEGELPIGEAVRILRDVVDALAHAHRRGVVHRDIKPDNVLLSERHALVTDFGVAKAVSEATGRQRLTTEGVALGTPAYMSPEQAAADAHIDHRADIYAVGALAYELLAGRPPFLGTTPQEVLAAHVTRAVEPVTVHRQTVPPALAQLVMRCLEKKPADRWQSAEEMLPQLEWLTTPSGGVTPTGTQPVGPTVSGAARRGARPGTVAAWYSLAAIAVFGAAWLLMVLLGLPGWVVQAVAVLLVVGLPFVLLTSHHERRRAAAASTGIRFPTPTGVTRHLTWPRTLLYSGAAFAALAVGTGAYLAMRALGIGAAGTLVSTGALEERARLLVAEFDNRTTDSTLGRSVTEAMRIDLQQSPVVRVVGSDVVAQVLTRMGRARAATVDLDLAREVAEREGIPAIVAGEVAPLGAGYALSARVVAADGTELVAVRETAADAAGIISALDRLSGRVRERIGESFRSLRSSMPLENVSTGSLEALRLYSRGTQVWDAGDFDRAVQLFEQAVAVDTTFAMAYRALSVVLENAGAPNSRQDAAATRAFVLRERLPPVERHLAEANYYKEVQDDRDAVIAAYRSVLDLDPEREDALNNLAIALVGMRRWAEAEELYRRSLAAGDSTRWQAFGNLAYAQFAQGDTAGAAATLAAYAVKHPDHPMLHLRRAEAATAELDWRAALVHLDSMRRAGRGGAMVERLWTTGTIGVLVALGRLAGAVQVAEQRAALDRERGDTTDLLALAINRANVTAVLRSRSDEAADALDRALARYPLAGIPLPDRPYVSLIQAYATAGRPDRARALYEAWRRDVPADLRTRASEHLARGALALSEGQPQAAVEEFRAYYHEVSCLACALYPMGRAYDAVGASDSALAVWSRGLDLPDPYRGSTDWLWRAGTLIRAGELHEARGESQLAAQRYGELVEWWRDADPELQPVVQDMRQRIARLVGEPRGGRQPLTSSPAPARGAPGGES